MNDKEKIESLVAKQLSSNLSRQEESTLQALIAQSGELNSYYEELLLTWKLSKSQKLPFEINIKEDFKILQSKILKTEPPTLSIKRILFSFRNIAALFILFLTCYAVFTFIQPNSEMRTISAELEVKNIVLEDGTKISLNKNTRIKFLPLKSTKERRIYLTGEALFDVAHTGQAFTVETKHSEIVVLGTSFNVLSLPATNEEVVSVTEGEVSFSSKTSEASVFLTKNEIGKHNILEHRIIEEDGTNTNLSFWQSQNLIYKNAKLITILNEIEKIFAVRIELENKQLGSCKIGGIFTGNTAQEIIATLNLPIQFNIETKDSNTFILKDGKCPS